MDVIVFQSEAYNNLVNDIIEKVSVRFNPDSLMTVKQVMEYTGFGPKWVDSRKELIGYVRDGKEIRFRKSHVDEYLNKHFISRKTK